TYLLQNHVSIAAVITQPDRPKGRSGLPSPSAVKQIALQAGLDVLQPEKASQPDFLARISSYAADLYVVVAFGQILPQRLLDIPPLGCINVHASLLPKYRGAAPMQRCLMDGSIETGVSIQKMVRQLDAGDVIAESKIAVPLDMTFGQLQEVLCEISKPLLLSVLRSYEQGIPSAEAQDSTQVTLAPKIEQEECQIDWRTSAETVHNKVRGLSPRPGAWCWIEIGGERKRLKVLRTKVLCKEGPAMEIVPSEALVYCGQRAIELVEVQPEGKKVMLASDWLRGFKHPPVFLARET
ncbi:MAG: methionyl-tRNA formyltransferase, partial [Chlamydiales bacterium]|nr:methionyl-tRNA formyltransferase [Chlamydiales bacterium]